MAEALRLSVMEQGALSDSFVREDARNKGGKWGKWDEEWACPQCTLHNEPFTQACTACGKDRPQVLSRDVGGALAVSISRNQPGPDDSPFFNVKTPTTGSSEVPTTTGKMKGPAGRASFEEKVPRGSLNHSARMEGRLPLKEAGRNVIRTVSEGGKGVEGGNIQVAAAAEGEVKEARQPAKVLRAEALHARYRLQSVLHHLGPDAFAGHYVTDVRDLPTAKSAKCSSVSGGNGGDGSGNSVEGQGGSGGWKRFDDSVVESVSEARALEGEAHRTCYICFYARC
ncbi:unnamed protein product [Choristocarpus tenellus]